MASGSWRKLGLFSREREQTDTPQTERGRERERGGEGGFFSVCEAFLLIKKEEPFGGLLRRALKNEYVGFRMQ